MIIKGGNYFEEKKDQDIILGIGDNDDFHIEFACVSL